MYRNRCCHKRSGAIGAPGRIRTCTVLLLREPPPAVGLLARLVSQRMLVLRQRVHARFFDALWACIEHAHTKRLRCHPSFESRNKQKSGAHTTESNLGPPAYKAGALAN